MFLLLGGHGVIERSLVLGIDYLSNLICPHETVIRTPRGSYGWKARRLA